MAENVMTSAFEYIFIFSSETNPSRGIKTAAFRGNVSNVYTSPIARSVIPEVHGATFPLEFATHFIQHFSQKSCYEPFAGTGTTLVASQNLNRKCYAIEISENYCAVILERMKTAFPSLEIKRIEQSKTV
jgi:DNA modification methylase